MVDLPDFPFKFFEIDDSDEFVRNAEKPRKHHEACWCGSGKKYKKCHRNRENQEPYTLGRLKKEIWEIQWRIRGCMHPDASESTCSGKVIDAHTIQRKGPLERIVDGSGHVLRFSFADESMDMKPEKIGWRRASTFPGFCASHDSSLFNSLESSDFVGSHEQCVLLAFRNICNEHYKKIAQIEALEYQRDLIDRGRSTEEQIQMQLSILRNIENQQRSKIEGENLLIAFNEAISQRNLERFSSRCYFFTGDINVVSSSAFQCEYDFQGTKLVDLWDPASTAEMLSHSIANTNDGGAIVFVWVDGEKHPEAVVSSFDAIPNADKGDIFIQYCFLNCENTYFSSEWWCNLPKNHQELIQKYARALYYEGGKFDALSPRLVNWEFA